MYFLLNAEFLAAVQLVVYAGGTLILIIFGVMLTSKSPFSRFEPKLGEVIIAMSIGVVLLFALVAGHRADELRRASRSTTGRYPVDKLGQALLGDYLVPFEVVSVLLLVVMIGAAYLAKGRRREDEGRERPPIDARRAGEGVVMSACSHMTIWHDRPATLPDPRRAAVRLRAADDPASSATRSAS